MSVKTGRIFTIRDFFFFKNLALSQAINAVEPRYTAALPGKSRRDSATGCILFTKQKENTETEPTEHTTWTDIVEGGHKIRRRGEFFCGS